MKTRMTDSLRRPNARVPVPLRRRAFAACALLAAAPIFAQSPHDAVPDVALGKKLFESQCALCHGQGGTGGRGPALNRPKLSKAENENAIRKVVREGILPEMPGAWQLSVREVASVAAYVKALGSVAVEKLPGDPDRGAAVYRSKGCAACHIAAGVGAGRGPELTLVGARRNAAFLRESIVTPNAFVPDGYLLVDATTVTGKTISGTKAAEDPFTIQIVDSAGRFHSLRKSELRALKRHEGRSGMPAFDTLSTAELDHLVAYLASLREAR